MLSKYIIQVCFTLKEVTSIQTSFLNLGRFHLYVSKHKFDFVIRSNDEVIFFTVQQTNGVRVWLGWAELGLDYEIFLIGFNQSLILNKTIRPNHPGNHYSMPKSSLIWIKLSGRFYNHLLRWSKMSKMTPYFKSPVSKLKCHPRPPWRSGILDKVKTYARNLKLKITYEDDLIHWLWPHPPRPQSGTIDVLQVPHGEQEFWTKLKSWEKVEAWHEYL